MTIESASRRVSRGALTVLAYLFASVAIAAVPAPVVKTDLKPGIRAGMQSPVQFAVLVPHKVSTAAAEPGQPRVTKPFGPTRYRYRPRCHCRFTPRSRSCRMPRHW